MIDEADKAGKREVIASARAAITFLLGIAVFAACKKPDPPPSKGYLRVADTYVEYFEWKQDGRRVSGVCFSATRFKPLLGEGVKTDNDFLFEGSIDDLGNVFLTLDPLSGAGEKVKVAGKLVGGRLTMNYPSGPGEYWPATMNEYFTALKHLEMRATRRQAN